MNKDEEEIYVDGIEFVSKNERFSYYRVSGSRKGCFSSDYDPWVFIFEHGKDFHCDWHHVSGTKAILTSGIGLLNLELYLEEKIRKMQQEAA